MYTGDWISSVLSLPVRPYEDENWNTNIAHEIITGRKGAIVVYWSVHTVNFISIGLTVSLVLCSSSLCLVSQLSASSCYFLILSCILGSRYYFTHFFLGCIPQPPLFLLCSHIPSPSLTFEPILALPNDS